VRYGAGITVNNVDDNHSLAAERTVVDKAQAARLHQTTPLSESLSRLPKRTHTLEPNRMTLQRHTV
jgi:hypothetical protein